MIHQKIIDKYRSLKKQSYLSSIGNFKKTYAFIGVGEHSLNNLYPCLQHMNVSLKYIYSRTLSNARKVSNQFPGSVPLDDYFPIFNDDNIAGVFICLRPADQQQALRAALNSGKHVFVEKPPCNSLTELSDLVRLASGRICMASLQRRYAPFTKLILTQKLTQGVLSYQYRFGTGAYPEGDVNTELFIHSVDFIFQLFGMIASAQIQSVRSAGGATTHLQLKHDNGVQGQVELSSHYLWNSVHEEILINCRNQIVHGAYPNDLYKIEKKQILDIPLEKIRKRPLMKQVYLDQTSFIPSMQHNTLYTQGFYSMVEEFLQQTETGIPVQKDQLSSLLPVYELIEKIRNS
jgi:virulence factor